MPLIHLVMIELTTVWFGLVWWRINHCWLFNDKPIFMHINCSISNKSV